MITRGFAIKNTLKSDTNADVLKNLLLEIDSNKTSIFDF